MDTSSWVGARNVPLLLVIKMAIVVELLLYACTNFLKINIFRVLIVLIIAFGLIFGQTLHLSKRPFNSAWVSESGRYLIGDLFS